MCKAKYLHRITVMLAILLISALLPLNILAASPGDSPAAVLKLTPGLGQITVNGVSIPAEKPYKSGTTLYIPLRAVMEAFGADVVVTEDNKIGVFFKDVSAELSVGKSEYLQNQTDRQMSAPPAVSGRSVMVPSDFVTGTFDIQESANPATGEFTFTLESDGALNDLSFLTGSLGKPKAGNSYFGWSLALPKGSVMTTRTFNSKTVQFENDYHEMAIDMDVQLTDGKSLKDYYKEIVEDPYPVIRAELIDSRFSGETAPEYIELYYADVYDEAIYHRIYSKNGYFYNLVITSASESDPGLLLKDVSVKAMLDSFSLDYKGGSPDTSDLSKVSYGLARYNNYITSDTTGKKFVSWEMSILPEWDIMQAGGSPYITQFGTGNKEYVSIETLPAAGKTAEETAKELQAGYLKNFNPALFALKSSAASEINGDAAYSLVYEVKSGKALYTYEERIAVSGGLAYDITFKTPSDSYGKEKESFENMLRTFKPYTKDVGELSAEMEKYRFNNGKNRMGKDDSPVLSENKAYSWSITLPGSWQKNGIPGMRMETFYDKSSGGIITVEAVAKKDFRADETDAEKFLSMSIASNAAFKSKGTESIQAKGETVKVYKYRIDDENSDNYADVVFYILEGREFSYCYMSSLPDLTASPANLAVMKSAWDSFSITGKTTN